MVMKCKKFLVAIFTFVFVFTGIFSFGVKAKALTDDNLSNTSEY